MAEEKKKRVYYNKEHQLKYQKTGMKQYGFRFVKTTDADIIERLDAQENKLGYIKRLIREDMERERREE